jgi:hypothetical protein
MHTDVHPSKNPPRVAPVRPVKSTGQTGVAWAARDEQHPLVNSPKSKPRSPESLYGLEQDFGDIRNTIAKFNPTKTRPKGGIEEIPPKAPLTLELGKPQNRAHLLTDLGGESQPKEPLRVPTIFPHEIPKRKVPKTTQEITKRGLRKSPPRTTGNNTSKP